MTWEKRIVWSEGMMLQPQHFQQQSRYHESQLRSSLSISRPYFWGVYSIQIDKSHLKSGKVCVTACEGILSDGSYFRFPDIDFAPKAIDINEDHLNSVIYLAVTIRRDGNTETNRDKTMQSRYGLSEHDVRDISGITSSQQTIEVSGLNFSLRRTFINK